MQERGSAEKGWGSPIPSPPAAPAPGLALSQRPLPKVTASSAAAGKLFVINLVLKDDVVGVMALTLLPELRSPGRRAGPG